jgi:outer membrane protein assembly factor BamA
MCAFVKYYTVLLVSFCISAASFAQNSSNELFAAMPDTIRNNIAQNKELFYIRKIVISGNKKTKEYIILRELSFREGDGMLLTELVKKFETSRQQVMNTTLFNEVIVSLKSFEGHYVDIAVDVRERWYIFPIPYFKIVDRNINVWLKQSNGSLDRVNYGLKFTHYNLTGRRDRLRLFLISGYNRELSFSYSQPYADKKLKHGFSIDAGYNQSREINFATIDNKQGFYKDPNQRNIRSTFRVGLGYSYRPGITFRHSAGLSYTDEKVSDSVIVRNPEFFGGGKNRLRFLQFSYNYEYFNLDYNPYPLKGMSGGVTFVMRGPWNQNNLTLLSSRLARYWILSPKTKTYFSMQGSVTAKLPAKQSFYNGGLLGYGDQYLRGLEEYVIDGSFGALLRTTLRQQVLAFSIPTFIKSKSHSTIPFRFFLKVYTDAGYAYNKTIGANTLNNIFLRTSGIGIDVVTFYDFVIRFEYSFNQLGQKGLFLHIKDN